MPEIKQTRQSITPGRATRKGLAETASLIFRVISDNRLIDDDLSVIDFASIPKRGAPYSFGGATRFALRAREYSPKYIGIYGDKGGIWDVEVSYDNNNGQNGEQRPKITAQITEIYFRK